MRYVRAATSLGRSGLQDWLLQRISAVVLLLYVLFWIVYFVFAPTPNYISWKTLFDSQIMRFASLITLFCLLIHAWIGLWTVSTDYIKNAAFRLIVLCTFALGFLFCLLWGFKILWSV